MCFDICTINIRVSIRVRGLHLVLTGDLTEGQPVSFSTAKRNSVFEIAGELPQHSTKSVFDCKRKLQ